MTDKLIDTASGQPGSWVVTEFLAEPRPDVTDGHFLVGNHLVRLTAGMDDEHVLDYGHDPKSTTGLDMKRVIGVLTANQATLET